MNSDDLYDEQMRVDFFKGVWERNDSTEGQDLVVYWAVTSGKVFACAGPSYEPLAEFNSLEVTATELITQLDLGGVDDDSLATIVETILKGGYLDKPGVKGKGEAVLYIVVNEALHALAAEPDD